MEIFVIDTNFFINLQRPLDLGKNKEEVLENFCLLVKEGKQKNPNWAFFSTPGSLKELTSFYSEQPDLIQKLNTTLTIKSPNITGLELNAGLFMRLVEEIGRRLYKGLRINEEILAKALSETEKDSNELRQRYLSDLRLRHRRATREGFLDSTTDLELILLAKELKGTVVSSDQGLLDWARLFGCQELFPELLAKKLRNS